ncbi:hypothetical protein NW752_009159 [Fusarium irregulare]|uniref:Uncharacterized protein n=1 Tax=Fusarium irregulare TaxID=2494466 RepID=A0A9W8PL25_9HYPO|nr:hypothetical protein NW766_008685 [Fusarium irregulare]KAJ4009984.1 hypothetical protein NW752_009159 [Fusarium irregulare]
MPKQGSSAIGTSNHHHTQSKAATVESDPSSVESVHLSSDSEGSWVDNAEQSEASSIAPSDSLSAASTNPPTPTPNIRRQRHQRTNLSSRGVASDDWYGHPMIPYGNNYAGQAQMPPPPVGGMYGPATGNAPMGYPSYNIRYASAPNMQGNPASQYPPAPNGQGNPVPPMGANPYTYVTYNPYANYNPPDTMSGNPDRALPNPTPPQPANDKPIPLREDPEIIRLEAEIAAFKAVEKKALEAERQREIEHNIRKEAENAFHQRTADMRQAEEEVKRELERARLEAEKSARERFEAEQKAEQMRADEQAQMMASAEKAVMERLRNEKELEDEKERQRERLIVGLEKEVRLKVEMEKRAELAEQEAKTRQDEDIDRLAKLKMLQGMDEVVSFAKEKLLHELVMDEVTSLTRGRQDWLMKIQDGIETDKGQSRNGSLTDGDQTSISKRGLKQRHATASTVRSASATSAKPSSISAVPPEAPSVPRTSDSGSDRDIAESGVGTATFPMPGSDHRGRAYPHVYRFGIHRPETHEKDLLGQIADAVIERLMGSPYYDVSIRRRQQPEPYYSTNSFAPASGLYQRDSHFGNQEDFDYGPRPCGPKRRFYRPHKPDHLRGRSLSERGRSPLLSPPVPSLQKDVTVSRLSTIPSVPSPLPPLEEWLDNTEAAASRTSHSEVGAVTQEPPAIRVGYVGAEEVSERSDKVYDDTYTLQRAL